MGKQEQCKVDGSKTYVLKFDMHCQCNGCVKKIKDGVKGINLSEGVERADVSVETGEVKVTVTGRMDPEKLCCLLQEATKKCVSIVEQGITSPFQQGRTARSGQTKKSLVSMSGQVASDWVVPEEVGGASWRQDGRSTFFPATAPSAPPMPEEEAAGAWSETAVPSERCWYRWGAPGSTLGVWAASEITGTLAMYEL